MKNLPILIFGGAAVLFTTGCWYDRPNPWDTADDREEYLEKIEEDWQLLVQEPFHPVTYDAPFLIDPDLEAWRDTVLANASDETLERMHAASQQKLAAIHGRLNGLAGIDEINRREQFRELIWRYRVEKIRLGMIESRLRS